MPDFPIVDSHVHILDLDRLGYGWLDRAPSLKRSWSTEDLSRAAAPHVIDRIVFTEVDVDYPQHLKEADWISEVAAKDKRLQCMVAALPLEQGAAVAGDLEKLLRHETLRGIRRLIQNQPDPDFCLRPAFVDAVKLLARHDLSFDICIFHHQMANAIKLVRQCPEVRFVLDHIGKPGIKAGLLDPWRQELAELAAMPNVHCKISGVVTEADHRNWTRDELRPYIAHAIETFGFDRVMFGGDWPVAELTHRYPQWVDIVEWVIAGSSESERRKLFRDNAIHFYRLDA